MPKIFTRAFCTLALLGLTAQIAGADNLRGEKVVLRALDKVTATTNDYTVEIGDTLKYGSLDILVQHCEKKPPEETPETFVFLQIFQKSRKASDVGNLASAESRTAGTRSDEEDAKLFSGWMFASSPALSALEHPVYDIWVLDCLVPESGELR